MKARKIIMAAVMIISAATAFAMEDFSKSTLSIGVVFPYMNQDFKVNGQDTIVLNGTGINLNYRHQNQGFDFGLFIDSDIFFPTSKTEINSVTNESKTENITGYKYFFGVDILAGVYTVLFKSSGLLVPAGAGIHMDGYASKVKEEAKKSVYTMGAGGWIACEINVSHTFGVYGSLKAAYDFYGKSRDGNGTIKNGRINAWSLVPSVGIALHI